MIAISTVIWALTILVYHHAQGDPSYEIQITEIKSISDNKEYVDPVELSAGTSTISIKSTVKKEVPQDAICETLFYKNVDGNFKKSPIGIAAAPCCEVMFENELFKRIMENQNVPKACPFTPGTYSVENYALDTSKHKNPPRGEYRANFTASLPSEGIIYGVLLTFSIVDKA
ncbi:uncharacterized protein LOC110834486 [Zootermopsis nevadensis]|uniref:MD-2-related lipid-recognition domain-containing protein n=1 Tax=Zootermopsis nevadensis TaxID=136037 RepID=A0A067QYC2_ZOONE|nr:uncharacterized protein LOC110834486 [Zootermopsis nevadensis]KDR14445.1 hypothetical protein L798_11614 [Zootermopsis nevadensis]